MKQLFKKLFCSQNNPSDINQSVVPKTLYNLSKYDKLMIQKYKSEIQDGTLTIQQDPDLKSLNFINALKINQLELYDCQNIVTQLDSLTIKELKLTDCFIQSVNGFQLENLEVLEVYSNYIQLKSKALFLNIAAFKKLKQLILYNYITDFSPLQQLIGLNSLCLLSCNLQSTEVLRPLVNLEVLYLDVNEYIDITALQYLTNLTKLALEKCKLVNIDALKPLVNLEELFLTSNKDIDITTLQYLTNLTYLSLVSCNLVNVDALRPLKKLEELDIFDNKIVFLQPLMELKQLSGLNASNNNAIDTESIQQHPNFDNFNLDCQNQPTQEELEVANMMRDINYQISSLKQICKESSRIKYQNIFIRQKITQQLQYSNNTLEQFVARVALLFQKIYVQDDYQ
ncbi:leucine-rich_repeat domain-containing protein [Hexamita inflata]|uniref:Leucine-rich repeat domain-containing protein n=1 Tax=Hexamita inflata TaxID=28002 RepID=A0AA86UX67_9EUKA|nr:leucine-rich repeat domain-containing protein [Hexamita inflata]